MRPTPPSPNPLATRLPITTTMERLPSGCSELELTVANELYYQCGVNWMKPNVGSTGTYYSVVPAP